MLSLSALCIIVAKDGPVGRINIKCLALIFLLFSTVGANAESFKITPESEALYFKALPYLDEIDKVDNDFFKKYAQRSAETKPSEDQKKQYRERLTSLLNKGIPLLKQSADEGNPAAQYRLAWISSRFEPRAQVVDKICTLLKSSLSHGFSPAGTQMLMYCFDDIKTAEFRSLIDALPNDESPLSKYYPQSTIMAICDMFHGVRIGDSIVSLDEKDIRANLYMSVATQMSRQGLEQERLRYLQKAAQYGCNGAIERLRTSSGG